MRVDDYLKVLYPGRDEFSYEERETARRAMVHSVPEGEERGGRSGRFDRLPWVFVPIGGRIRLKGKVYECVKAGPVMLPSQACSGCDLRSGRVQCVKYQCSPFDRSDKKFTWFKEVSDE